MTIMWLLEKMRKYVVTHMNQISDVFAFKAGLSISDVHCFSCLVVVVQHLFHYLLKLNLDW